MASMKKKERISAVLAGKSIDRVPVAFWRHWPGDDQRADSLAAVALDFQRRFDLDFIKLPVSSTYTVADYGVKYCYQGNLTGDCTYIERVIKKEDDWERIQPLDITKGTYGWHLDAIKKIIKQKDKDTPVVVTMFNPLSTAGYLAGDEVLLAHLRSRPGLLKTAISAVTDTCVSFARAVIEEGADGIFLSTRFASHELMSEAEYRKFGIPGDLAVLKAADEGWFNVLHLHGQYPMLAQLSDYPVQAFNWHDRTSSFNLAEAGAYFKGALMAGVEQHQVLRFGKPEEVKSQARDAIRQVEGRRIILTPGCTYHIDVPQANLLALRQAVEKE